MKGFLGLLNPSTRASSDSLQQPLLSREEQMDAEHTQTTTDDDNKKLIYAARICDIETIKRLLKQKIDELKKIFESKNLENLQTLKFELLEQQLNDGEEDFNEGGTSNNLAEE